MSISPVCRSFPCYLDHRAGEDVSLPCGNVINPDCSSTGWKYNKNQYTEREIVSHGKPIGDAMIGRRLSLESNCSLTVRDVRPEDAGRYMCQQFTVRNGPRQGEVAHVFLVVLTSEYL